MPLSCRSLGALHPCDIKRTEDDIEVQDGLAMTPAMVEQMTAAGVPLSQPLAMGFFDGYKTLDFDPGVLGRRGTDIIDAWNAEQDSRKKMRDHAQTVLSSSQKGGD